MAKKKSSKQSSKAIILVAILFGLLSCATIFLPAFKSAGKLLGSEVTYTGLQTAFGYKETTDGLVSITVEVLKMNVFSLLAYALPLASIILLILFGGAKLFDFIAMGGFFASAVFAFLALSTFPNTVIGAEITSKLVDYSLAYGSILCIAFSCIAGLSCLVKLLKK